MKFKKYKSFKERVIAPHPWIPVTKRQNTLEENISTSL